MLDEIQRIPMLLNEVHRLIEARRIPFAMTGSSARSLRRRGVNLLAGRAHTYRMHPLTAGELGADFDPAAALRYGHLPAVCGEPDPDAYLASCVETSATAKPRLDRSVLPSGAHAPVRSRDSIQK